jgi:hypothetical protein
VGPRAVLDAVVKRKIPSPHRESNPTTPIVQPVASHYTDLAVMAGSFFSRTKLLRNKKWLNLNGELLFCIKLSHIFKELS